MRLTAGQEFAGCRIQRKLGRGGMATVYLADELDFDRQVALKVLPEELAEDADFVARFHQEARTIAALEHPNIIPLYRFGIDGGVPWMALRYVAGGDLAQQFAKRPIGISEGLALLGDVAQALDHAHKRGVIHRDLKPQNILLDGDGHGYLADFGVAKLLESSSAVRTATGGTLGTPNYMSPEQARGLALTPASDLYALGVICFQWLTGALPFDADTPHAVLLKHIQEPLPDEPLSRLPKPVAQILSKALAKDPAERYPTARALIDALRSANIPEALSAPSNPQQSAKTTPIDAFANTDGAVRAHRASATSETVPRQESIPEAAPSPQPAKMRGYGASIAKTVGILVIVWSGLLAVSPTFRSDFVDGVESLRYDFLDGIGTLFERFSGWAEDISAIDDNWPVYMGQVQTDYDVFHRGSRLGIRLNDDNSVTIVKNPNSLTLPPLHWQAPSYHPGNVLVETHDPSSSEWSTVYADVEEITSNQYTGHTGRTFLRRSDGGTAWPQSAAIPAAWLSEGITIRCEDENPLSKSFVVRFSADGSGVATFGEKRLPFLWAIDQDQYPWGGAMLETRLSGQHLGATLISDTYWLASEDSAPEACRKGVAPTS
jgi:serine/threonine-protein kinase